MDYPEIIKTPMDLGTVRQRLQEGAYNTMVECAEDVRLIWSNCVTYNCDGKSEALLKVFPAKFMLTAPALETAWVVRANCVENTNCR